MADSNHLTYVYIGLAGEGDYIGDGGLVRRADGEEQWTDISQGLPMGFIWTSIGLTCPSTNTKWHTPGCQLPKLSHAHRFLHPGTRPHDTSSFEPTATGTIRPPARAKFLKMSPL